MTLYALYHCNEWHEIASFRLIGVVSKSNLKKSLKAIKKECNYTDKDMQDYIHQDEIILNDLDI